METGLENVDQCNSVLRKRRGSGKIISLSIDKEARQLFLYFTKYLSLNALSAASNCVEK